MTSNVPEPSAVTPKAPAAADASLLGKKHPLCSHNGGCVKYSFHVRLFSSAKREMLNRTMTLCCFFLQALVKTFLYGWGLHSCIGLVVSLPRLFRRPSRLPALLRQSKHVRFGAFLASLSAAYRVTWTILSISRQSPKLSELTHRQILHQVGSIESISSLCYRVCTACCAGCEAKTATAIQQ